MRRILDDCGIRPLFDVVMYIFVGMMIFCLVLGVSRARASGKTIEELEAENLALQQEVSSNKLVISSMVDEINQMQSLLDLTMKQKEDQQKFYEHDIKKLKKKVTKLQEKKNKLKIKYQNVKTYLTKDEIWLANYISKGGTVEDAGIWYCTAYCTEKRKHICGTGTGITASGEPVQAFVSVALSKSEIKKYPYGTHLYIEGIGERIVMDTGGGVRHKQIDCAVDTHHNAVHWKGQGDHRVWVLKEEK